MMNQKIQDMLQSQLTLERTNQSYYQALSAAADVEYWPGAKAYFEKCAKDEADHAQRVQDYLVDRGLRPLFESIPVIPDIDGKNYAGMFQAALAREKMTTAALTALWLSADDEANDPQTVAFITIPDGEFPGFIQEQTDSERELTDYLSKINRDTPGQLETFDQWLEEKYKA